MRLNHCGSEFAWTAIFFVGAIGCSEPTRQKEASTAKASPGAKKMLAVEEPSERSEGDQPRQAESEDEEKSDGEVVEISMSSMLTTSPQEGMLQTRDAFPQQSGDRNNIVTNSYLRQILHETQGGASNAFLVDATDASDAVNASFRVLVGSGGAEIPVPVDKPDLLRGSLWLVVYLGSGPSNPTWWTVEGVTVDKARVVLSYRKPKPQPATDDRRRYYYWVPLGKLDQETYEIQLFDADKGVVTLMRRVEVMPTTERGTQ